MTDDTREREGGMPPHADGGPEPVADTPQAPARAFGRRPDIAGSATVLSHNFRAPIVPEAVLETTAPAPVEAGSSGLAAGLEAPPESSEKSGPVAPPDFPADAEYELDPSGEPAPLHGGPEDRNEEARPQIPVEPEPLGSLETDRPSAAEAASGVASPDGSGTNLEPERDALAEQELPAAQAADGVHSGDVPDNESASGAGIGTGQAPDVPEPAGPVDIAAMSTPADPTTGPNDTVLDDGVENPAIGGGQEQPVAEAEEPTNAETVAEAPQSAAVPEGAPVEDGEEGAGFDAGPESDDPETDEPAGNEAVAASLLAVPVLTDRQDDGDGDAGDEREAPDQAPGKREIRFDGSDAPLAPPEGETPVPSGQPPSSPEEDGDAVPLDEAELARRLGISFRDGDAVQGSSAMRPTREEAEIARKLGIRFRDDGDDDIVAAGENDGLSDAARQLGIAFRDSDDTPSKNIKKSTLTGRLIMLITLFSGLAGLLLLVVFGESLMGSMLG